MTLLHLFYFQVEPISDSILSMKYIKFKKIIIFVSLLLVQPVLSTSSLALAKRKTPPKAFSFIAEGEKASQEECDGERKIPKLKRMKEFAKVSSYMGSELQNPEIKGKADEEMWKHFFKVKASCNTTLAKTPSALETSQVSKKTEILPEEAEDLDNDENTP